LGSFEEKERRWTPLGVRYRLRRLMLAMLIALGAMLTTSVVGYAVDKALDYTVGVEIGTHSPNGGRQVTDPNSCR
jgi:hypothetical protein